ncbi:MAG TPA: 50S ribosomal protein L30 [Myxococcales bacterium]|nr:50S ribosomal protein L30 [Myxococcales bacterium]
MGKRLKVTQTGSTIARPDRQAKVLLGLGLGRIGKSKELEDTASIRGMIYKVQHLVSVEEVK